MIRLIVPMLLALLAGCRTAAVTVPEANAKPEPGQAAIITRGRIVLPVGLLTDAGEVSLNLESQDKRYKIGFLARQTVFYPVDPGTYELSAARSLLGERERFITVIYHGTSHRVPIPPGMLGGQVRLKPGTIEALGVLEARVTRSSRSGPEIQLRLDSSVGTRRKLIQETIHMMMDPKSPETLRQNAYSWSRALEKALIELK